MTTRRERVIAAGEDIAAAVVAAGGHWVWLTGPVAREQDGPLDPITFLIDIRGGTLPLAAMQGLCDALREVLPEERFDLVTAAALSPDALLAALARPAEFLGPDSDGQMTP